MKVIFQAFLIIVLLTQIPSCKTRNLGSFIASDDDGCSLKPTARYGTLFFADSDDQRWFFKLSDTVWADQISSKLGKPVIDSGCSSFLITQFQEMDADVQRFFGAASQKLPMSRLNEYGFGVVQAIYQGFEKNLKTGLSDPVDRISVQKSLGVVSGHLQDGTPFVATAPLDTMLQAKEELNWTIIVSPPQSAYVAKERDADGTERTTRFRVKSYTCGNSGCRLTDIPGVIDDCPSCGTGRLFGTTFYNTIGQASEIDLSDWGTLSQSLDGPDVGCSVCGVSNAGSSVKPDGTLTCRNCSYEGLPVTNLEDGKRLIKKLAQEGNAWLGVLSVPKTGGGTLRGGTSELSQGFFDAGAVLGQERNPEDLNFYGNNEDNLERSKSAQAASKPATNEALLSSLSQKPAVRIAAGALGAALVGTLGWTVITHESVVEGQVTDSFAVTSQVVEQKQWRDMESESRPNSMDIRNLSSRTRLEPIMERQVVGHETVDPPKSCSYKDLGNGTEREDCVDPPPQQVPIYDNVKVGDRKITVYSWQEPFWNIIGSADLQRPIDADDNDQPDPLTYPNESNSSELTRLLSRHDTRLGQRSVSYFTQVNTTAQTSKTYPVDPNLGSKLDQGTRVKITSSILRGNKFEF